MAEFWALTPKELYAVLAAAQWQHEQAQRHDLWLAWHIAALSRTKRLPALQKLIAPAKAKPLHGPELEKRRTERDEMLAQVDLEKLNAARRKDGD